MTSRTVRPQARYHTVESNVTTPWSNESSSARYGRKTIFYICAVLQLILGVAVAFVPEFYSLLVVRFFYGVFGSAGAYITGFVLSECTWEANSVWLC